MHDCVSVICSGCFLALYRFICSVLFCVLCLCLYFLLLVGVCICASMSSSLDGSVSSVSACICVSTNCIFCMFDVVQA